GRAWGGRGRGGGGGGGGGGGAAAAALAGRVRSSGARSAALWPRRVRRDCVTAGRGAGRRGPARSQQAQLQPGGVGHLAAVPGWVEDDVDARVGHPGDTPHPALDLGRQLLGGRTRRRGQRHANVDLALGTDRDAVDQSELVDVDRDLGVVTRAQRVDHQALEDGGVHDRLLYSVETGAASPWRAAP